MKNQVILANGTKMAYMEDGQGVKVVFVHGLSSSKEHSWGDMFPALIDSMHCYAYDQPGHGDTELGENVGWTETLLGDHLNGFLEALDLRDVVLVGHSLGGLTVLDYILHYGCDRLKAVVVVDQSPSPAAPEFPLALRANLVYEDVKDDIANNFRGFIEGFYRGLDPDVYGTMSDDDFAAMIDPIIAKLDPDSFGQVMRISQIIGTRECLKDIEIPFGYFYADPGSIYSPELADYYRSEVSGPYEAVRFNYSTHVFPWLYQDEFCDKLKAYIAKLD